MMKVALVHEFLTQFGGAERVLSAFHEMFPTAPVFTLVYNREKFGEKYAGWDIRTSYLQGLPGMPGNYKWYLPLMPLAIQSFDFSGYDLVLSDSSAFAKGVITKKPTAHICYCHTPTRYLWESRDEYLDVLPYPALVKRVARSYLKYILGPWDLKAAHHPDFFLANSKTVRERIRKYYRRDAAVIYPPVDTGFFKPLGAKQDYFFTASRLEPYKKTELVLEAFRDLALPLKVAGDGTSWQHLKSKYRSSKNISFLGQVTDENLRELYRGARAFVFPALEDAGIMTLESLACGTPVIGLNQGGTAEFIENGINGVLFENQKVSDLTAAVRRFLGLKFHSEALRDVALGYSKDNFKEKISDFLQIRVNLNQPRQ